MELYEDLLKGIKVLCVNDEPDIIDSLVITLKLAGADVRGALGIDEALEDLNKFQPQVLVCEFTFRDAKTGFDLITKIRQLPDPKKNAIPAIAVSGWARLQDMIKALELGYSYFIANPCEPEELISAIRRLLQQSSQDNF